MLEFLDDAIGGKLQLLPDQWLVLLFDFALVCVLTGMQVGMRIERYLRRAATKS